MRIPKTIFLFAALLFSALTGRCQPVPYEISGTISGQVQGRIYIFFGNNYRQKDSLYSEIKDGKFIFKGTAPVPVLARLHLDQTSIIQDFYIDGGKVTLSCTNTMQFEKSARENNPGGKDTVNDLRITSIGGSRTEELKAGVERWRNALKGSGSGVEEKNNEYFGKLQEFISDHPGSIVSPYLLGSSSDLLTFPQAEKLAGMIDPSLKTTYEWSTVKQLLTRLEKTRKPFVGMGFHDIVLKDTADRMVDTRQFRGKIVLVECWASWCGPCRQLSPSLAELRDKHKKDPFEIIGVSFDTDKGKWKKAIQKDKLSWPQVIDTRGFKGVLGTFYAIEALPGSILLDKNGRIIGMNPSPEEIEKALAAVSP